MELSVNYKKVTEFSNVVQGYSLIVTSKKI